MIKMFFPKAKLLPIKVEVSDKFVKAVAIGKDFRFRTLRDSVHFSAKKDALFAAYAVFEEIKSKDIREGTFILVDNFEQEGENIFFFDVYRIWSFKEVIRSFISKIINQN